MRRIIQAIWDVFEAGVFALGIMVVVYHFLFIPSEVQGVSSYPHLQPGERIITEKVSYTFSEPERGDMVVLRSPYDSNVDFVKRIVGLPGEVILLNQGVIYINGKQLIEPYLEEGVLTTPESYLLENKPQYIPSDYYFVMGDNRSQSSDSREFGPVKRNSLIGKVIFRIWPIGRIGQVKKY